MFLISYYGCTSPNCGWNDENSDLLFESEPSNENKIENMNTDTDFNQDVVPYSQSQVCLRLKSEKY